MSDDNDEPRFFSPYNRWQDCEPIYRSNPNIDTLISADKLPQKADVPLIEPILESGELFAICGHQDLGKSQFAVLLSALISNPNLATPLIQDGKTIKAENHGKVVFFGEEDSNRNVQKRFIAAGGLTENLMLLSRGKYKSIKPVELLSGVANIKAVIFDHWETVSHGYGNITSRFEKAIHDLLNWARSSGAAIIIIGHYTKNAQKTGSPVDRTDFPRTLRIKFRNVYFCETFELDPQTGQSVYAFLSVKGIYRHKRLGMLYEIVPACIEWAAQQIETSRIQLLRLLSPSEVIDLTSRSATLPTSNVSKIQVAKEFLIESLANGPRLLSELLSLAASRGITESTLKRAGDSLSISSKRELGQHGHGGYLWSMPTDASEDAMTDAGR